MLGSHLTLRVPRGLIELINQVEWREPSRILQPQLLQRNIYVILVYNCLSKLMAHYLVNDYEIRTVSQFTKIL